MPPSSFKYIYIDTRPCFEYQRLLPVGLNYTLRRSITSKHPYWPNTLAQCSHTQPHTSPPVVEPAAQTWLVKFISFHLASTVSTLTGTKEAYCMLRQIPLRAAGATCDRSCNWVNHYHAICCRMSLLFNCVHVNKRRFSNSLVLNWRQAMMNLQMKKDLDRPHMQTDAHAHTHTSSCTAGTRGQRTYHDSYISFPPPEVFISLVCYL